MPTTVDARSALIIDTSAAVRTVTLPNGASKAGKTLGPFKRMGANNAVFHRAGTDKIDGNSADFTLTTSGSVVSFTWVGGATGWMSRLEGGAATVTAGSGVDNPTSGAYGAATFRWINHECEVTIPRTPPSPVGVYRGEHVWGEIPVQSDGTAWVLGETDLGSDAVGEWKLEDLRVCPYNPAYPSNKIVFRIASELLKFRDDSTPIKCGFYLNAVSDQNIEADVVQNGKPGATPFVTCDIYPEAATPSGGEYGDAGFTFDVVKGEDDNSTGVLRTPFTVTCGFANPDPNVKGYSIWFRGDGEAWKQETAMMDLTVASIALTFDTPAAPRNIYFYLVLHGLSPDGSVKANSIDETRTAQLKKLSFGVTTGTIDPEAWDRAKIGSGIQFVDGKWDVASFAVGKLTAGTAVFTGDTVFARSATGPRVGINATGLDIYSTNAATTPYVSANLSGVLASAGGAGKPYTNITAAGVTVHSGSTANVQVLPGGIIIQGAGLGTVELDASSVSVKSGGTPKLVAKSTDITIYGAGTATAKLDGTSLVLDSGTGPKATIAAAGLTLDSGGTPKVIVSTAAVQITQGKLTISASGVTATLDVTSYSDGNRSGIAGLVVSNGTYTCAIAADTLGVYGNSATAYIDPGKISSSKNYGADRTEIGMDAVNKRLYMSGTIHGRTSTFDGYTGYYGPVGGLYIEITGGFISGLTATPPI